MTLYFIKPRDTFILKKVDPRDAMQYVSALESQGWMNVQVEEYNRAKMEIERQARERRKEAAPA